MSREWKRSLIVIGAVAIIGALIIGVSMGRADAKHRTAVKAELVKEARALGRVNAARESGRETKADIAELEDKLTEANELSSPLLKRSNKLRRSESAVRARVQTLQNEVDMLTKVPNVAGDDRYVAQSEIEARGLSWNIIEIDGTCADYNDHFLNRGLGWGDVVKQSPSPDTRVRDDATVDMYIWDYSSNWEFPCF